MKFQIARNKGLTPKRKKEQRNPRVRHRKKFEKAKIKRKSQVRMCPYYIWCVHLTCVCVCVCVYTGTYSGTRTAAIWRREEWHQIKLSKKCKDKVIQLINCTNYNLSVFVSYFS